MFDSGAIVSLYTKYGFEVEDETHPSLYLAFSHSSGYFQNAEILLIDPEFDCETLEKQLGREPTMDEIAGEAGLSRREVTAALESVVEPLSLEEPLYTDGGDAMYVIDQVRDPDGEDSWISGLQFRETVASLTPREKRIMELRYLKGETQMEVAREIGISQAQVSRLEKAALEQFRSK